MESKQINDEGTKNSLYDVMFQEFFKLFVPNEFVV